MSEIFRKFKKDPVGLVSRGVRKTVIDPMRYKRGDGYDAEGYWRDRLKRYSVDSLRGGGDEGLSEEANQQMYAKALASFEQMAVEQDVEWASARVLEVGLGNGFWARALHDLGVTDYDGADVTDTLYDDFRAKMPGYRFHVCDVTKEQPPVESPRSLAMFIDVIEHIVEEDAFRRAMKNVGSCVAPRGLLAVSPIAEATGRKLFYTRFWSVDDVCAALPDFELVETAPFRYSELAWLRKM